MKKLDRVLVIAMVASALTLILSASAALAQHGMIDIFWWFWRQ